MDTPKISVIVPVYKVEPYLRKCLDSIVNQTYENLEIILVDDGSPDNCGAICDEYAARDGRVKVIHQENGGVSSARNAGLDIATGEWVAWVDPDDWIEPDMFQYLLQNAQRQRADIVACGVFEHGEGTCNILSCEKELLQSGGEYTTRMIEQELLPSCWNKISRKSLWMGLCFPNIRIGEDLWVTCLLTERAERVLRLPEAKYHYVHHEESAVTSRSLQKWLNAYQASKAWYDRVMETDPLHETLAVASCLHCAKALWCHFCEAPYTERKNAMPQMKEIAAFCAPHIEYALENSGLGISGRTVLRMVAYPKRWAFIIAGVTNWAYQKKWGKPL